MAYVITSPCKNEKAAECAEPCPVNAIYAEEDVPDEDRHYIQLIRNYFK